MASDSESENGDAEVPADICTDESVTFKDLVSIHNVKRTQFLDTSNVLLIFLYFVMSEGNCRRAVWSMRTAQMEKPVEDSEGSDTCGIAR